MSKRASPTLIGGFVLGAVALVLGGLVVFGGGRLFRDTRVLVTFFDGNVNGLAVGAPVKFRGVQFGDVREVVMLIDAATGDSHIEVVFEIARDTAQLMNGGQAPEPARKDFVRFLVEERGMRAKLATQSVVTGQLYVELDFYPDTAMRLVGLDRRYLEIPSIPSDLEKLRNTFSEAIAAIRKLPIEQIAQDLRATVASVKDLAGSEDLRAAIRNVNTTLAEVQALVRNVDARVGPLLTEVQRISEGARGTLARAEQTFAEVADTVAPGSPLRDQLVRTLEELSAASRSIRVLADYIERHPNAVLFGKTESGGER